jgi:hypothetical protein
MRAHTARLFASFALAAATLGAESLGAQAKQLMACFVPRSGTLYLVGQDGTPTACRATDHVLVQWNTVGQEGPAGNTGPQGPPGPVASGTLSGLETVVATFNGTINNRDHVFLTARCPAGKVAISGGLLRENIGGSQAGLFYVSELGSYPNWAFGRSRQEWVVVVGPTTPSGGNFSPFIAQVVAVCATAS